MLIEPSDNQFTFPLSGIDSKSDAVQLSGEKSYSDPWYAKNRELVIEQRRKRYRDDSIHREQAKLNAKRYWLKNRERLILKLRERSKSPELKLKRKQNYKKNANKLRNQSKIWRSKRYSELKDLVFKKFECKCSNCGFSDIRALQIDHVKNDGHKEKSFIRSKRLSYLKSVLNDNNSKYQLLCANCNWIKEYERRKALSISEQGQS